MTRRQMATGLAAAVVVAGTATLTPMTSTSAASPAPVKDGVNQALGNGLGRLLAERTPRRSMAPRSGVSIDQDRVSIRDQRGNVLIQLTPQAGIDRAAFRRQAEAEGLDVQAVDRTSGTMEGFVPLSSVNALASLEGTGTIAQSIRPKANVGAATSQGVALQRVDKVHERGIDGRGITLGALSDSYDAATTDVFGDPLTIHAADDVKSGDLPGRGNRAYRKPVRVLDEIGDPAAASDEGRAMLQIAHDVAPASTLCFATAFNGAVSFADNIRRLASKKGGCRADVIVDDVVYYDEPMFSDGIISDAVDDVAAQGVHYFSSAGNAGNAQSWNSKVRLVPAAKALEGTDLDFSEVDPALYDGGLQDMDPGAGTDVAQDVSVGAGGGLINLQWDDPVDLDGAKYGDPVLEQTGEITDADPDPTVTFTPTAAQIGSTVEFRADGIPSGSTDLVLSVEAPDGTNLGEVDTGTSPETLAVKLTQPGTYTATVTGFKGETGDFTLKVRPLLAPSKVSTDFNVLIFDAGGSFLGALADANTLSGRPIELAGLDGPGDLQLVVSRSGKGPVGATRLRNVLGGSAYFTEFSDPLSPAVFGHATAKGATAVGAYDPFRPFLPEFYTSPGGDLPIYFDSAGDRYPTPQVRRVPQVSGADRVNTTFFVADDPRDTDQQPNFGGTSAAAPHVAAIAALMLQKGGAATSYTPSALRDQLIRSTFDHDLDPAYSSGSAGGLTVRARGGQGYESGATPAPAAMTDPDFFTLSYSGKVPLRSVTFYGETASPTAPGTRHPPLSDGIVFDPRPLGDGPSHRDAGFPFTIGSTSGGLQPSKVAAAFSVPGGGESAKGQYRRMTLRFKNLLERGQGLSFGVDRDLAISGFGGSNEGNGADELGGGVFLPNGIRVPTGLAFVAERTDGRRIFGMLGNRLGQGFSPVDGYGLVNAEKAVR